MYFVFYVFMFLKLKYSFFFFFFFCLAQKTFETAYTFAFLTILLFVVLLLDLFYYLLYLRSLPQGDLLQVYGAIMVIFLKQLPIYFS